MMLKILLVEDTSHWQDFLREAVEQVVQEMHVACEIRVINDFEQAWTSLAGEGPWHLLVTDIGLGGANVSRQKRGTLLLQRAQTFEVPSLVVSGTPLEKYEVRDFLKDYGADDFFEKYPFNRRNFMLQVKAILQKRLSKSSMGKSQSRLKEPRSSSPVDRKRRRLKPLPSGTITAMFTDIVNSTKLKPMMKGKTAADSDAKFHSHVQKPHNHLVLSCVKEAGGHKVKPTGDGYFFTFTDAEEAVLCALQIQERLATVPINTPLGPLQVRIGLHTGIATPIKRDYIASTIDKAARVQGQAGPGQVFVSRATHALVGKLEGVAFEKAGTFELKGLEEEPEDLYRALRARASGDKESPH